MKPLAIALVIAAAGIGGSYLLTSRRADRYQQVAVSRLPNSKGIVFAAVSPDGEYLVYADSQSGQQSLKLRQISTTTDVELTRPQEAQYRDMQFSRDGKFIYYSRLPRPGSAENEIEGTTISRIPKIGGHATTLLEGVVDTFSLSADSKRLAFIRYSSEGHSLLVADEDGSNEAVILTRPPSSRLDCLAWSPDGRSVAFATWEGRARGRLQLFEVEIASRAERQISTQVWGNVYGLDWVADGSGLIVAANMISNASQIWHISYPGGELRNISNDANNYVGGISLSADSRVIVSGVSTGHSNLWMIPDINDPVAEEIKGHSNSLEPAWTPDGQIVFTSTASGDLDIWIMQADATNLRQLTFNDANDMTRHLSRWPLDRIYLIPRRNYQYMENGNRWQQFRAVDESQD